MPGFLGASSLMRDDHNPPWCAPYVQDAPLPGIDPLIQNCFPTSGLVHHTMWYLVQTGYTSPLHHLLALLPALANEMALRGWHGAGRGKQIAIQSILVGPSGAAKSTAIREVQRLVNEATQAYYRTSYNEELHDRWIQAEGSMAGILETLHSYYVDTWDTPVAGNIQLQTTPAVLYHEEFSSLLQKRDGSLEKLLELFDPVPKVERNLKEYRRMRAAGQRPPSIVRAPAVSGVFATTPATLQVTMTSAQLDGGLGPRLLWGYAVGDKHRLTLDVPDRSQQRAEAVRYWIQVLKYHDGQHVLHAAEPKVLPLDWEVKRSLQQSLERAREALGTDDRMASMRIRALNTTQLISQIYAWSKGYKAVHIDDLIRAQNLMEISLESFETSVNLVEASESWAQQEVLRKAIEGSGGMTRSQCYKLLRCGKGDLESIIDALRDRGVVDIEIVASPKGSGGRPQTRYVPMRAKKNEPAGAQVIPFRNPSSAAE
jgi:hypothetical protein